MTKLEFTITINTTAERVWHVLFNDYHYRQWTSVFCEGSYAVSDWKEGSKIHFLSPNGGGMYSKISVNKPFEKMYFTHIGEVKQFEEQPLNEETKKWTGSTENYTLTETNGITVLHVGIDMDESHVVYFNDTFPKGLARVKELAEAIRLVVKTTVNAPLEKTWNYWTEPTHVMNWNNASPDWHTPKATNDLRVGGAFSYTMAAKDGSFSFDFNGTYTNILPNECIEYTLEDDRTVKILFEGNGNTTTVTEFFEPETVNSIELQYDGWQAILTNFKNYTERN